MPNSHTDAVATNGCKTSAATILLEDLPRVLDAMERIVAERKDSLRLDAAERDRTILAAMLMTYPSYSVRELLDMLLQKGKGL